MDVLTIDHFLKDPAKERRKALEQNFIDVTHNDLKYRGIAMTEDARNLHRIEDYLGVKFKETTVFYRRNLENEPNETFIHSDILIGSFTGILYLSPNPPMGHGTAFWRHKTFGFESHEPAEGRDDKFWKNVYDDGFDEEKWEMTKFVPMAYNRLLLFYSPRYHSRYPKTPWTAKDITEARLIKVFFGKI